MDGGKTFSTATVPLRVVPGFDYQVGRRPYIWEQEGSIIYRIRPDVLRSLYGAAGMRVVATLGNRHSSASHHHDDDAKEAASPVQLFSVTRPVSEAAGTIGFSLTTLPTSVDADVEVQVTLLAADGSSITGGTFAGTKRRFLRTPPPPPPLQTATTKNHYGNKRTPTVFQVDHHTGGMLLDGWLPFTALGWFNSPFEYSHESAGDMSLIAADVPTWVARGGSQAVEWAKRGHTLIRVGSDHAANASLVRAILDECEKAGIYVMFSPPASTFATDNTTEARAALISNLTMVMDHPALWGYYVSVNF